MKKIIHVLTFIMYPYCSVLAQNDQCQEQGIRTNPDDLMKPALPQMTQIMLLFF